MDYDIITKEGSYWVRSCVKKATFPNKKVAKQALKTIKNRYKKQFRLYKCDFCNKYHLTSVKDKE